MPYLRPFVSLLILARLVVAQSNQTPEVPLAEKKFEYNNLPYKVDTDKGLIRGEQSGYNICNGTTQNQESLCQTAILNSIDDFCIWSAPEPNSEIGDIEGEAVAYCTKPDHGTRLFPEGSIKGLQFTRTPDYIQIVGFMNQSMLNLKFDDFGGEMDPHGADLRGNPMGGLVFTKSFTGEYKQVIEWHNFVGANYFCFKACDPAKAHDADFCEHRFDRIGCQYNAPSNAKEGEYTSCDGENQLYPGIYVQNGATMTYQQPPESLGPINDMPYTASVPSSSNCQTFQSTQLFSSLPASTPTSTVVTTTSAASSAATDTSRTATGAAASSTSSSNNAMNMNPSLLGLAAMGILGFMTQYL